ncbi:MAG: J domain-containing protein [Halanaerobiaceae bacterium]
MSGKKFNSKTIYQASQTLKLGQKASKEEIKNRYKKLIKKWHPDNCQAGPEKCRKKTEEITEAYQVIKKYCENYRYSFVREDILDNLPVKLRFREKLGNKFKDDPLWN